MSGLDFWKRWKLLFLYLFFGLPWLRELSKDSRSIIFAAQKRRIGSITHRPLEEPPQKKSFEREEFLFCVMADYGGESIMTEHINWFVNVIPNGENAGCRPDTRPYVYMKTNGTFSFFSPTGFSLERLYPRHGPLYTPWLRASVTLSGPITLAASRKSHPPRRSLISFLFVVVVVCLPTFSDPQDPHQIIKSLSCGRRTRGGKSLHSTSHQKRASSFYYYTTVKTTMTYYHRYCYYGIIKKLKLLALLRFCFP